MTIIIEIKNKNTVCENRIFFYFPKYEYVDILVATGVPHALIYEGAKQNAQDNLVSTIFDILHYSCAKPCFYRTANKISSQRISSPHKCVSAKKMAFSLIIFIRIFSFQ